MTLSRKPFAEFAVELAAGLAAGRGDEPIAESARLKIVEIAPGDWRLSMVLNGTTEILADESFPTRAAAMETIVERLVNCPGELRTVPIQ
jgi:hypothetical protein